MVGGGGADWWGDAHGWGEEGEEGEGEGERELASAGVVDGVISSSDLIFRYLVYKLKWHKRTNTDGSHLQTVRAALGRRSAQPPRHAQLPTRARGAS